MAVVLAGALVSAAKQLPGAVGDPAGAPAPAYTAALCICGLAAISLVAISRGARAPRTQLMGALTAVVTGLLFLLGQHTPLARFWSADMGSMLAAILIAAAVAIAVSWLVAPSLANDEVRCTAAFKFQNDCMCCLSRCMNPCLVHLPCGLLRNLLRNASPRHHTHRWRVSQHARCVALAPT